MNKQLANQPKDPDLILEEEAELLEGFILSPKARQAKTGEKQTNYSRLHHRILYFLHWRRAQGI